MVKTLLKAVVKKQIKKKGAKKRKKKKRTECDCDKKKKKTRSGQTGKDECKPELKLVSVQFVKDLPIPIYKDQIGQAPLITGPEWVDTDPYDGKPETNERVAYVKGTSLKFEAEFKLTKLPSDSEGKLAKIRSEVSFEGANNVQKDETLEPKSIRLKKEGETFTYKGTIELNSKQVQFFNPMKLKWTITSVYGKRSFETEHQVYVTFKEPFLEFNGFLQDLNTLYLTSLHLATSNAGAKKESEVINNTWKHFQGKSVQTWGSPPNQKKRRLSYYKRGKGFVGTCDASSLETFLIQQEKQSGECGAFAKLFMAALAANGIQSKYVTISSFENDRFLVHKWNDFSDVSQSTPFFSTEPDYKWKLTLYLEEMRNVIVPVFGMVHNSDYEVARNSSMPLSHYGDLESQSGIAGQNSLNPSEKVFDFHFIVKVPHFSGLKEMYYDPSYGVTYNGDDKLSAAKDFEEKVVAGYAQQVPDGVRKNNGEKEKHPDQHKDYPYKCNFKVREPKDASGNYIGHIYFDK